MIIDDASTIHEWVVVQGLCVLVCDEWEATGDRAHEHKFICAVRVHVANAEH